MPKVKKIRKKRTNGFHNMHHELRSRIGLQHIGEENSRYLRCSAQLFPHLVYVSELTVEFVDRAAGFVTFPKSVSFLNIMPKEFYVTVQSDSLPLDSLNDSQNFGDKEKWPYSPVISIWGKEHIQKDNGVLFMSKRTFSKTIKMLDQRCLDSKIIRSVITHSDVREVHEALTEMLETPIWELLNEIKEKSQVPSTKPLPEALCMELDVLLNTVKHSSKKIIQSTEQGSSKKIIQSTEQGMCIPQNLKDYLSRKREVFGFGLWNQTEFCVFLNRVDKTNQVRHLQANLFRMNVSFFKTYTLKVLICRAQVSPYLGQGDKIFRPELDRKYLTLGCFVKDSKQQIYALTSSHGVPERCTVTREFQYPDQEKIGTCIYSSYAQQFKNTSIVSDVALIKINDCVKSACHLPLMNHDFQDACVDIHAGNLQDIAGKTHVFKIGASTSVRKGLIKSADFVAEITNKKAEVFLVTGLSGLPFAEGGDSGSIVFINKNSSALDTILVIGMVSGNMEIRETEKPDDHTDDSNSENIYCYKIGTTLKILQENGWNVSFENQI